MMILDVSKRPLGYPVPIGAMGYYCHPQGGHVFEKPALGRDGKIYVSNCHVALRFFNFPPECGTGPMAAVDRLRRQRWHDGKHEDATAWRKLDDCTLDLFKDGLLAMWQVRDGRALYRVDPCARVNHGFLCPLVSLQAISRLPRCEVYTEPGRGEPMPFRFNGGDGLVARLSERQEAARTDEVCHVFARRRD